MKKIKPYIYFALTAPAVGAASALLTMGSMEMYRGIALPPLAPPSIAFPIVWSVLYILMGIGGAIVYKSSSPHRSAALWIYGAQLFANFLWSIIFFNLKAYTAAFLWILVLLILVAAMIYKFVKVSKTAGYIQIPYLLWVIFATYLSFMIAILN